MVGDFKYYNQSYQRGNKLPYDGVDWNNNIKATFLGFKTTNEMHDRLDGFTTQWSRQNAIDYIQNPTLSNSNAMFFSEYTSQWTDPEELVMGASILIGGMSPRSVVSTELARKGIKFSKHSLL